MNKELKPCPFCGGNNAGVFNWEVTFQGDYFKAYCEDCDFELKPQRTEEEAIESWNTRKPIEKVMEQLKQEQKNPNSHVYAWDAYEKAIEIAKGGAE